MTPTSIPPIYPHKQAVILVSGTRHPWPHIEADPQLAERGVHFYRFVYGYIPFAGSLKEASLALNAQIEHVSEDFESVVLVGYSLGGTLIKDLLTSGTYKLFHKTGLVAFIAAPVDPRSSLMWPILRMASLLSKTSIAEIEEKWNVLLRLENIRTVSVVGLRDRLAPFDTGRHWDVGNVLITDKDHDELGSDIELLRTLLLQPTGDVEGLSYEVEALEALDRSDDVA